MPELSLPAWAPDPVVLVVAAIGLLLWLRGLAVIRRVADPEQDEWDPWRQAAFLGALAAMLLAASGPIDELSAQLFWMHMVQHLLLLMLVAPLLVAAAPWYALWWGLPDRARRLLASLARRSDGAASRPRRWWPAAALALFIAGIWVWHLPSLYDLALSNEVLHDYGEHNTFLLVGVLFWMQVLPSPPFRPLLGLPGRAAFLAVAIIQNVILSVILAFAGKPLYAPYAALAHRPGGLSALADQQLGASIMWSVGDLPFVIALVGLVMSVLYAQMDTDAREGTGSATVAAGPGQ